MGMGGQCHTLVIYPHKRPGTYCIGGWVGPKGGLDGCGTSNPHQDSILGVSSPHSESLYRLSYAGPYIGK